MRGSRYARLIQYRSCLSRFIFPLLLAFTRIVLCCSVDDEWTSLVSSISQRDVALLCCALGMDLGILFIHPLYITPPKLPSFGREMDDDKAREESERSPIPF